MLLEEPPLLERVRDHGDILRIRACKLSKPDDGKQEVLVRVGCVDFQEISQFWPGQYRAVKSVFAQQTAEDAGVSFGFSSSRGSGPSAAEDEKSFGVVGNYHRGRVDVRDERPVFAGFLGRGVRALEVLENPLIFGCRTAIAQVCGVTADDNE